MNNCVSIGKYAILDHLLHIIVKWHEFITMYGGWGFFPFEAEIHLIVYLPLSFWEVI